MGNFDDLLEKLASEQSEQLLEIARFAELGMSASAVIHELRQPLTALSMALQITRETARGRDPEVEKGIEESLQLVAKAEMLLERARDFMRPSVGKELLDLEECITRVLAVFQWQLTGNDTAKIGYGVDEGPLYISADKAQFEQMLANLVSNALDAVSENGGGSVYVKAFRNGEGEIEVVVADNGSGVDSDTERHMFEPFFTTKGAGKGTGLGLFIVSKIASRHGASCSFLEHAQLAALNLPTYTTAFSVRFREDIR